MSKILKVLFGDPNKKLLSELGQEVEKINALESGLLALSDEQLKAKTTEFKNRLAAGEVIDDLVHEAFAVVREAGRRTLGQRHFDVQLIGGLVLHRGQIAEMRTGEGKTLTSTLALYTNALRGQGCHLVTVNDYLAKRDAVWMGQIFDFLGLTVGCIQQDGGLMYDRGFRKVDEADKVAEVGRDSFHVREDYLRPCSRKEAYDADITYGTNNQFGFDYLRDNMAPSLDQCVMRELHYAIVDEIDSILIDEARTPLIISAPAEKSNDLYYRFAQIAATLIENEDFNIDEKMRASTLTEAGIEKIERTLGIENLYAIDQGVYQRFADTALRARANYQRDVHYVVNDGQVLIVDEFTGRLMQGRRFSGGIHQAIEAKEGVPIQNESRTMATITFQNYFRLYQKLAGMTGTAATESEEFKKIYNLDVVTIPTHKKTQRLDQNDLIFKTQRAKYAAIAARVEELHRLGQPVLIGTTSIEKNEIISSLLKKKNVPHQILNAKNHRSEAEIIAKAGVRGAVTVATNMAGRGVDIILGGPKDNQDQKAWSKNHEEVVALGGLYVIGTERHESRRIDNQLRGRSGRQGDPGFSEFYVALDDDLMRIFGGEKIQRLERSHRGWGRRRNDAR